ncbi:hypothetical protein HDU86_002351 [Geranomyces michiganensis]|nr:hypothetical protein HDU86_002351 [Geranomyces michiganensis]
MAGNTVPDCLKCKSNYISWKKMDWPTSQTPTPRERRTAPKDFSSSSAPQKSAADIAAELRELRATRVEMQVQTLGTSEPTPALSSLPRPAPVAVVAGTDDDTCAAAGFGWVKDLLLGCLLVAALSTDVVSIELKAVLALAAGLYAAIHYRPARSSAYILADGSIERSEQRIWSLSDVKTFVER